MIMASNHEQNSRKRNLWQVLTASLISPTDIITPVLEELNPSMDNVRATEEKLNLASINDKELPYQQHISSLAMLEDKNQQIEHVQKIKEVSRAKEGCWMPEMYERPRKFLKLEGKLSKGSSNVNHTSRSNDISKNGEHFKSNSQDNRDKKTELTETALRVCGDRSEHFSTSKHMGNYEYYYNSKTGESTWTKPKKWVDKPANRPRTSTSNDKSYTSSKSADVYNSSHNDNRTSIKHDKRYPGTFICGGFFIDCIVDSSLKEKSEDKRYPGTFVCDGLFVDCIVDSRLEEKLEDGKLLITDTFRRMLINHLLCMQTINNKYELLHHLFVHSIQPTDITTKNRNTGMECRYLLSHFNLNMLNNGKNIKSLHTDLKFAISQQSVYCAKAIAWKLTRLFVKTLPNMQVDSVWPAFICACNCKSKSNRDNLICAVDIVIVVEVFNIKETFTLQKVFYDIPITYREVNGYSKEANLISKRIDQYQGVEDELSTVNVSNNQAKDLFTAHSKLCLITKSSIRSKGYFRQKPIFVKGYCQKQTFVNDLCVQLFCRIKGIIPVGEAHFPTRINSIATDVIEGYPQLLAKYVKIGSEVGSSGTGTLGGFVKFNGEDALLTCAHVVLGRDMLGPNANRSEIHMNPVVVNCKNPREQEFQCGKLVYYVFPPELIDGTSVDAAIIRMDPSTQISQISVATDSEGHDLKPMYLNNNFVDYRSIGTNFNLQVAAVGAVSSVHNLKQKINLVDKIQIEYETLAQSANKRAVHFPQPVNINDCNHFVGCLLNDVGKAELINPRTVTFHQQISMRNVSFRQGDSGMCVYVKWPGVEYQCLGMAIASHPDGGCIITPIKAILSAFKLI